MKLEFKRKLFVALGFTCVGLAIVGIPLPLLPTTPFLLLAAYFFSRGSPRFHSWLLSHKHLGPPIHDWRRSGAIALRVKVLSALMMLGGYAVLLWHPAVPREAKLAYPILVLPAVIFVWTRPSS